MQPIVVTSGVDSEYVLSGLAEYLRGNGFTVHEIDFGVTREDVRPLLRSLRESRVSYVTSSHTNLTSRMARTIVPLFLDKYPNYLAPLEIMPLLQPQVSVYVPHDLLSPFGDANLDEFRFLDMFDHIIAPYESPALQAQVGKYTRVHDAGWIKYQEGQTAGDSDSSADVRNYPRIAFFISFTQHLNAKYGPDGIAQYFQPLLTEGVRIKLPVWSGVEAIEDAIRKHTQAEVVDSRVSSASLIAQSDLVLCNGASSILAEAILSGVPGICVLDAEAEPVELKLEKLREFPQLVYHDYHRREPLPQSVRSDALAQELPKRLKPVDYAMIEGLLREQTLSP